MTRVELTDLFLRNAAPATRTEFYDTRERGLVARISPQGSVSWELRFRFAGKNRRHSLGDWPGVSLAEARDRARRARALVADGVDPREERREREERITFAALAQRYLAEYAERRKRSARDDAGYLRRELLPRWRRLPADSITRRHVIEVLEALVDRGVPTASNRLRACISRIYSWALERELVPMNPVAGVRARASESPGSPVLTDEDLRAVWPVLTSYEGVAGALYQVLVYTGQREQEIRLLDLSRVEASGFATIPREHYKTNAEHRVYLVPEARALLDPSDSGPAFPSDKRDGRPLASLSAAQRRIRERSGVRHFGGRSIRATVATRLRQLGTTEADVGVVLGHSPRSVVGRHYIDPRVYDAIRKRAMLAWARELHRVLSGEAEGGEVVRIG